MQKKHLQILIDKIPDSAEIYINSDHGIVAERAGYVLGTLDIGKELPFYGNNLSWKYLTDMTKEELKQVKAILIQ